MPTDSRSRSSGTSSGDPATEAWVISPGCSIRLSTAPSDSASVNSSVAPATRLAASAPPRTVKLTIPPKSRICLAAAACPGWSGSCGYSTRSTAGWRTSRSTTARALEQWRSIRTPSVFTPRSTR